MRAVTVDGTYFISFGVEIFLKHIINSISDRNIDENNFRI